MSATTPTMRLSIQLAEHSEALILTSELLEHWASEHDHGSTHATFLFQISSILAIHGRDLERLGDELTETETARASRRRKGGAR